jgi:hypothetical protein
MALTPAEKQQRYRDKVRGLPVGSLPLSVTSGLVTTEALPEVVTKEPLPEVVTAETVTKEPLPALPSEIVAREIAEQVYLLLVEHPGAAPQARTFLSNRLKEYAAQKAQAIREGRTPA